MLAEANVWADLIAIVMVVIPIGFWIFQISGNFLSGRFYKKFVEKQWPHHDEVIPPAPKIIHGSHVALMMALGISGMYTRFPFFEGGRDVMKWIHFICMYLVVANAVTRVYYAFIKDAHQFKITPRDIVNSPKVILYYTFIKKHYPHLSKYNVMQKMTYGHIFPLLMVIQAYTGFALMWPRPLLGWSADIVGGIAVAAGWSRVIHFLSAMLFLQFTLIHVCLATIEDFPSLFTFFGLKKQELHHDDHGHHSDHGDGHDVFHEPEHEDIIHPRSPIADPVEIEGIDNA
jgi:thiosulfate reductase cytochrome b subunit